MVGLWVDCLYLLKNTTPGFAIFNFINLDHSPLIYCTLHMLLLPCRYTASVAHILKTMLSPWQPIQCADATQLALVWCRWGQGHPDPPVAICPCLKYRVISDLSVVQMFSIDLQELWPHLDKDAEAVTAVYIYIESNYFFQAEAKWEFN